MLGEGGESGESNVFFDKCEIVFKFFVVQKMEKMKLKVDVLGDKIKMLFGLKFKLYNVVEKKLL